MTRMAIALFLFCALGITTAHTATPAVRNIVLVHGAFADASSWSKVIPLLEAKGFNVTAVQIPLSSLADDVAATKRTIALQNGPIILVGHSYGGAVISEAGNDPKVQGLVYVSALVPDKGQAAIDGLKPYPPPPGSAQQKVDPFGYVSLTRQGMDEDFVPELSATDRAVAFATQKPINASAFTEKVMSPAWLTKPSWYIAVHDRMLPPQYEQDVARRIHATTTTLASGHVPMLSMPQQVADVIVDAANKAGGKNVH